MATKQVEEQVEEELDNDLTRFIDKEFEAFSKLCPPEQDPVLSILRLHLLAEYHLERLFHLRLPRGDIVSDGALSFSQKLKLAEALDILDSRTLQSLKNLNVVRNRCAHEFDKTITESDVELIGRPLGKEHTILKRDADGNLSNHLFYVLSCLCRNLVGKLFVLEQDEIKEDE